MRDFGSEESCERKALPTPLTPMMARETFNIVVRLNS